MLFFLDWNSLKSLGSALVLWWWHRSPESGKTLRAVKNQEKTSSGAKKNGAKIWWGCHLSVCDKLSALFLESMFQLSGQTEGKCLHTEKAGWEVDISHCDPYFRCSLCIWNGVLLQVFWDLSPMVKHCIVKLQDHHDRGRSVFSLGLHCLPQCPA